MTHYKRVDLAVKACSRLNRPLVVVGKGEALKALQAEAAPCVRFLGRQDDDAVADLLARSKALLFPGEEDFGIVPLEAAASGVPVLAYGRGGATETVCDGVTGLFFTKQSVEAVEAAILEFERRERDFDPQALRRHAESFSEKRFRQEFARQVELAWTAQSRPPER